MYSEAVPVPLFEPGPVGRADWPLYEPGVPLFEPARHWRVLYEAGPSDTPVTSRGHSLSLPASGGYSVSLAVRYAVVGHE